VATAADSGEHKQSIFLLGFSWTASSLLAEISRQRPALLPQILVVDFNPEVNEQLRGQGVHVVYGDISQRDVLLHAGIAEAQVIICSLPDMVLKGGSNMKLLRQLRGINETGRIVVHAEKLTDVPALYAAGANYVMAPRLLEAADLLSVIEAVERDQLATKRATQTAALQGRNEVIN
jgi:voltage-gated potassium channel Kch